MPASTAILIVNGFDRRGLWGTHFDESDARRYPWLEICLREVARRSEGSDYGLLVWDNTQLPEMRALAKSSGARLHPSDDDLVATAKDQDGLAAELVLGHNRSLQRLWSLVPAEFEFVMTLDTDAFPIRDGWLETLHELLDGAALAGIWRDEMTPQLQSFVHPSCLIARREGLARMSAPFAIEGAQDVGQRITREFAAAGEKIAPLRRSNVRNAHFVIGGIYGDLVYHHGAGSRVPVFRNSAAEDRDIDVHARLRAAVFENVDRVVAVLRGASDEDIGLALEPVSASAKS
ncbi:MAG: hypothetical protein E6J28_14755 [Chloroflexi bacterium]|nr:MAG: hypothetical protein E6J28_14755 [Chloroflexota bacterium]